MNSKLNCILLIDDDEPTNVWNEMVLLQTDCCEKPIAVESGPEAIDFLMDKDTPNPDLILLDLNMPEMDGWEFLQHYQKMLDNGHLPSKVVILSTSENPDHIQQAVNHELVASMTNKPFSVEAAQEIMKKHFGW